MKLITSLQLDPVFCMSKIRSYCMLAQSAQSGHGIAATGSAVKPSNSLTDAVKLTDT